MSDYPHLSRVTGCHTCPSCANSVLILSLPGLGPCKQWKLQLSFAVMATREARLICLKFVVKIRGNVCEGICPRSRDSQAAFAKCVLLTNRMAEYTKLQSSKRVRMKSLEASVALNTNTNPSVLSFKIVCPGSERLIRDAYTWNPGIESRYRLLTRM